MSYRTFALEFLDERGRTIPDTPTARIKVVAGTGFEGLPLPYITADCKTKSEIDFAIDRLIEELQNIRSEATSKLSQS